MVNFVILSGGVGSRLWPKSREHHPKQFLKMIGDHTMLQYTILRIFKIIKSYSNHINNQHKIIIICNKLHIHIVQLQIDELQLPINVLIITEPKGRDSGPAVCISSLIDEEDEYTVIMPCDHILNDEEFIVSYKRAINYIDSSIVTFGIKPTHIETSYGYIKTNDQLCTEEFIEKPNYETASVFFNNSNFLWNAGIFAFKNKNMIKCFKKYASDILNQCILTLQFSTSNLNIIHLSEEHFMNCRSISFDYCIMEVFCKDDEITIGKITIPYNSHWNDLGLFISVFNECEKTEDNNVLCGDIVSLQTTNCYIEGAERLITTVGLNGLIIIDTTDALLICDKNKSQNIKQLVDVLKQNKREEVVHHKITYRPWGWYKNIEGKDDGSLGFKIKRIGVYPGRRLSLQSHNFRSEHWVIVKGQAKVTLQDNELYLEKDQNVYIPVKTLHRIENVGDELLEFIETQIGDYLEENDIIRYDDDYGRI
jgi:mannose-1-phosphate guanylyltransferase